jgi:hypothetical protein
VHTRAAALILGLLLAPAPEGWHGDLDAGLKAAKESGKPVLVVTLWGNDQCLVSMGWREKVQRNATVRSLAARFERVEWLYGTLSGKVIPWTRSRGGTSDDPKVQAFVVEHDGKLVARCPDADVMEPRALSIFLQREAEAWDRTHARTKVPFLPPEIATEGEGATRKVTCRALLDAKAEKVPAAVYVWKKALPTDDAKGKAESEACRRFDRESLGSAEAAKAAEGWTLVLLDRADADQALLAKSLGVEVAPAVVLVVPGEPKPVVLDRGIGGGGLAVHFRKYAPAKGR